MVSVSASAVSRSTERSAKLHAALGKGLDVQEELDLLDSGAQGRSIQKEIVQLGSAEVPLYVGEYWESKQRSSSSLHEVSYRACFKANLPRFFIELLTLPGERVYDPFAGRGTTLVEAALLGRTIAANDINPLSRILSEPRVSPPTQSEVASRLSEIFESTVSELPNSIDLSMFYHDETLKDMLHLRSYLWTRRESHAEDYIDKWIRMIATNRLTGHSPGFFSVYSLPPNQAVTADAQIKINEKLGQIPDRRDVQAIILKKSKSLLSDVSNQVRSLMEPVAHSAIWSNSDSRNTPDVPSSSISLVVTSPPFLDIVNYAADNWLRCWFNAIDIERIESQISVPRKISQWENVMRETMRELFRVLCDGGMVAFEVGEVRKGKVRLEEHVLPLGLEVGFVCEAIMINSQEFTKTANIWGVKNNLGGTNSNRIVIFRKPGD